MEAAPIPPSSTGIPPILLYRRETVGPWKHWNTDFSQESLHGFGVAVFDVGLLAPLAVASVHLNPFVADKARDEAKLLATRAMRYGPYGIVAGDISYPPCPLRARRRTTPLCGRTTGRPAPGCRARAAAHWCQSGA